MNGELPPWTKRNIVLTVQIQKINIMDNQESATGTFKYLVYDEMACEALLSTNDLNEARNNAYNYQCVLIDNETKKVIHDYSC